VVGLITFASFFKHPIMLNLKRLFLLLVLPALLLSGFPYEGNAQKRSKKKQKTTQSPDEILKTRVIGHISVLAHDSLEGRRTGTLGEQKAFNYIASQYRGLEIGSISTYDYMQTFTIDEGKFFAGKSTLSIDEKVLKPLEDYFPFAWSGEGAMDSDAVVALNESGEAWWIDLEPILQKNKENPHFSLPAHIYETAKDAIEKGATAILFFNSGTLDDQLTYLAKDRAEVVGKPVLYIKASAIRALEIEQESAPYVKGNIAFEKLSRNAQNLVAYLDNNAPTTIVIGAHYDHLGYGEDENSRHTGEPEIHNGADDNASGTAAVIELAKLLKEKNDKRFNYLFVHFSGEELGLYGSKYFTENPPVDLKKVNYMINLDMVGRLNDSSKVLTLGGVGTSPAWGSILPQPTAFTLKYDSSGTGPSDHTSFYRKEIPVLFFFTGLHTDYHKPSDDAERINYDGMVSIVRYIENILLNTPTNEQLAFSPTKEQNMGAGRFKVSIGIMPDYTFSGTGVKADGVIDGRPAKVAGLQANDVILQLGEHLITGVDTYMQALNRFDKGQTTTIVVKRGEAVLEKEITF
jgi:aminopeptidase YwaD